MKSYQKHVNSMMPNYFSDKTHQLADLYRDYIPENRCVQEGEHVNGVKWRKYKQHCNIALMTLCFYKRVMMIVSFFFWGGGGGEPITDMT